MSNEALPTVWVMGDQLNRSIASLLDREPGDCRILLVESTAKRRSKRWHVQRLHLVVSAMAHFAAELADDGFEVDYRQADTLRSGLVDHCDEFAVDSVTVMEPASWDGRAMVQALAENGDLPDVEVVANNQFLCDYQTFADWAEDRSSFKMEDFYRWQRQRLDVLMEGDDPAGGSWNYDDQNREPPPDDGGEWPGIERFELDDLDREVLDRLTADGVELWGAEPCGLWPVTRDQALQRLDEFIEHGLEPFGAHQDAMVGAEWKLAHSCLASSINIGLLDPGEVVEAAEAAYRERDLPLNSVEGFIRQIIGWREYVWGLYWLWMPDYRDVNELGADRPVPPAFTGESSTGMACVANVIGHVHDHGYAHHIERLMVLGNLALTAGVEPQAMTEWMWASFVDAAEWVMVPNVVGMALHADGGRMATKPYASGGAYIDRMSDHCGDCRYDRKKRTGDDSCPFTTLYWDFLARHRSVFGDNHRMARQVGGLDRLSDLDETRERATEVLDLLDAGEL